MTATWIRRATVVGFAMAACSWPISHAQLRPVGLSGIMGRVSPAVVATWMTHTEPSGMSVLDLAVFWRGTPGWFMAGGPSRSAGGSGSAFGPDGRPGVERQFIVAGDLRLDVRFDPMTRQVQIQNQVISLNNDNVILVDDVDGPGGPRIAETRRIDPQFPSSVGIDIPDIIRRSPDLFDYLRCEAVLADPAMQQMMELVCARMRP
jgi:hypothetical protein